MKNVRYRNTINESQASSKELVNEIFKDAGVDSSVVEFLRAIQSNDSFKGVEVEKEFLKDRVNSLLF